MCDLSWIAGRSQNLVSHHLRTLRSRGLVRSRRDGKLVMYSLTERGALAPLGRAGRGVAAGARGDAGVSRPKKMLPVLGQASRSRRSRKRRATEATAAPTTAARALRR